MNNRERLNRLVLLALFAAIAFVVVALVRIPLFPAAPFLKYEPKDVIFAIAGFLFGPLPALGLIGLVCLIEMITISTTGVIGFVMNVIASAAFALPAAILYEKRKGLKEAVMGLAVGVVLSTLLMILWNYLLTPLFMAVPREKVVPMLLPIILPFNLIKNGLNAALTMLLYKPLVSALRSAKMLPQSDSGEGFSVRQYALPAFFALIVLAAGILWVLIKQGVI